MALSKDNFQDTNGVIIPKAYIKVDSYSGYKGGTNFMIGIYNVVQEEQEIITPTEQQVEITLEDGTTEIQTTIENIITNETVEVKKKIGTRSLNIVPDFTSDDNILVQGYKALKLEEEFSDCIDC